MVLCDTNTVHWSLPIFKYACCFLFIWIICKYILFVLFSLNSINSNKNSCEFRSQQYCVFYKRIDYEHKKITSTPKSHQKGTMLLWNRPRLYRQKCDRRHTHTWPSIAMIWLTKKHMFRYTIFVVTWIRDRYQGIRCDKMLWANRIHCKALLAFFFFWFYWNDFDFFSELIRNQTLKFLSKTLPVLKTDDTLPKVTQVPSEDGLDSLDVNNG